MNTKDGTDILAQICDQKRQHVERSKSRISLNDLRQLLPKAPAPRGFLKALEATIASGKPALIAELKKASPSKGVIRKDFYPPALAKAYEMGGATCLSVLTDIPYFQGSDEFLQAARNASQLPVLRKDFMLDPYQIVESRVLGADCVLLILAALKDDEAEDLENIALSLGMDVLLEVHDHKELARALAMKSRLIGINNRNLKSMEISLDTTTELRPLIGKGYTVVCESGIHTHGDIAFMQRHDVHSFLVGESLMKQDNVTKATRLLLGEAA
jgi:indole-3-glycerol phosphate synthase